MNNEYNTTHYDILILGGGPAGIAAALSLENSNISNNNPRGRRRNFLVLEGRSRVGGRAYTFDSLDVGKPLDKGARWIHGTCSDNRIIQLLCGGNKIQNDCNYDSSLRPWWNNDVDDENLEYGVHLPYEVDEKERNELNSATSAAEKSTGTGMTIDGDNNERNTNKESSPVPPFETPPTTSSAFNETDVEHMIVRLKGHDEQQKKYKPSTRTWTKLIFDCMGNGNKSNYDNQSIIAKEPSPVATKLSTDIFQQVIMSTTKNPSSFCHNDNDERAFMETASLMDSILWIHFKKNKEDLDILRTLSEKEKRDRFTSLCQQLVETNKDVQDAKMTMAVEQQQRQQHKESSSSLSTKLVNNEDKEAVHVSEASLEQEVLALLYLKIYTFFESWEGAPIHLISAKHGDSATCLPGPNVILPFGYGGLIRRMAYPLLVKNIIRLGHEVISIKTSSNTSTSTMVKTHETQRPNVIIRCKVPGGTIQEFHASSCIIALPLGVLRAAVNNCDSSNSTINTQHNKTDPHTARTLTFEPRLPPSLEHTIQTLGIAVRNKIELLFSNRWWPLNVGRFHVSNMHMQASPSYHPYTTFLVESASASASTSISEDTPNILVCYVAGEFAREMEHKSNAKIQDECMQVLRQADFRENNCRDCEIPDPISIHVTRWLEDPFSRGSWTFYGKGSTPKDVREFRANTECKQRGIFFAGEHTCSGEGGCNDEGSSTLSSTAIQGDDMGCVHGAWLSGELAAQAALKFLELNDDSVETI